MKQMKFTTLLLIIGAFFLVQPAFAMIETNPSVSTTASDWTNNFNGNPEMKAITPEMAKMGLEQFLTLTPAKYKELTGKKLGFRKTLELKAAQKIVKKHMAKGSGDISKGLYILLAILGLGWVAMGIMDDWDGSDWIVNLVLTVLCWLPGVIHAFIKMKKYY